jgi:hypothetical protein
MKSRPEWSTVPTGSRPVLDRGDEVGSARVGWARGGLVVVDRESSLCFCARRSHPAQAGFR